MANSWDRKSTSTAAFAAMRFQPVVPRMTVLDDFQRSMDRIVQPVKLPRMPQLQAIAQVAQQVERSTSLVALHKALAPEVPSMVAFRKASEAASLVQFKHSAVFDELLPSVRAIQARTAGISTIKPIASPRLLDVQRRFATAIAAIDASGTQAWRDAVRSSVAQMDLSVLDEAVQAVIDLDVTEDRAVLDDPSLGGDSWERDLRAIKVVVCILFGLKVAELHLTHPQWAILVDALAMALGAARGLYRYLPGDPTEE